MKTISKLSAIAAAAVLTVVAVPAQAEAPAPFLHGALRIATHTPCAQEDSANCYWDATARGNGVGHSFVTVRVGGKDVVIYTGKRFNKTHGIRSCS